MTEEVLSSPRIIVGVDGSENAGAALEWAIAEARSHLGSVEAVHAWQFPALAYGAPGGYAPLDLRSLEAAAEELLESAVSKVDCGDVKVFTRCEEGYAADVLRRAAEQPDVLVTVVGARGHSGLSGLVLGSVSHSLTHNLIKPLVIVPPGWSGAARTNTAKVVVGIDGSAGSARALSWAVAHAKATSSSVEAVMVWPVPDPVFPPRVPLSAIDAAEGSHPVEQKLFEMIRHAETEGVSVHGLVLEGHPAAQLLDRARDSDMLVVGTRGHSRARELFTGSVSHACSNRCTVPVAVIPAPSPPEH